MDSTQENITDEKDENCLDAQTTMLPRLLRLSRSQPFIHQLARTLWAIKPAYEAGLNMNTPTLMILSLLAEQDGLTQNDLTGSMRVDASIITRIVKQMEYERKWIRRERDPGDNRLMRVYLTEEGRRQTQGLVERVETFEKQITRNLTQTQMQELQKMLQVLEETARTDCDATKNN